MTKHPWRQITRALAAAGLAAAGLAAPLAGPALAQTAAHHQHDAVAPHALRLNQGHE